MRGSKQLPRNDYLVEVARRGVDLDEPQLRRGGKLWMAIPAPRACRRSTGSQVPSSLGLGSEPPTDARSGTAI